MILKNNISNIIKKKPFFKSSISTLYKHNNFIIKKTSHSPIVSNNEYNILKDINNRNIIKLLDNFDDSNYNYLVFKYYPYGDLYYNIYNNRISINDYKHLVNNLVDPICYLHNNNIVHLDLKLENYLVNYKNNSMELILFDFNLSKKHNINYYNFIDTNFIYGTENYMAPEILDYKFSKASDIYSLGCMLYSIFSRISYKDNINYNLLKKNDTPSNIISLITDSLNEDSLKRPTIFDIKHYYLT